ncbi:hypothetical protein ABW20_dc0106970 [Dactylellina cionopaga]|nr:hypothetical protein ABW20_dc0106970 [Dactylellina cionopaga]
MSFKETKIRLASSPKNGNLNSETFNLMSPKTHKSEENSQCWLEAKVRFGTRIRAIKHPPSQQNIDDFLSNNVNVNKAIVECEKLKAKADRRYEGPLGKLLGVLSVLKDVGDQVLTCAPESVSIAWGIISLLVGVGINDMDNCGQISEASTNIVTIILNCRLYENRHNYHADKEEFKTEPNELAERVMEAIKELITAVLEFFWHANRKFREDNKLKRFCDIFSVRSTASEKYEAVISQYKDLRNISRVEFEDNVLDWLQSIKRDNAKLTERLKEETEESLKILLLPPLDDIRGKLESVQEDVREVKVDVKAVKKIIGTLADEVVGFRDETAVLYLEQKTKERFEKCYKSLKPSSAHIQQFIATLEPLKGRNTRYLARWLFDHQQFLAWETGATNLFYIKGQPGFGKSVAMAVAIERLLERPSNQHSVKPKDLDTLEQWRSGLSNINEQDRRCPVLFFFFKRGDGETQHTERALSCLVAQLFNAKHTRSREEMEELMDAIDIKALQETKEKKAQEMAKEGTPGATSDSDFEKTENTLLSSDLLRIERMAHIIGKTVYIVIDGIDECTDYHAFGLVPQLIKLGRSTAASFKILMSSREDLDLEKLFAIDREGSEKFIPYKPDSEISDALHCVAHGDTSILTVTKSTNEHDMKIYLEDSLTELLNRGGRDILHFGDEISNQKQVEGIKKMVDRIQKKAEGMFTYSAMAIASLNQPSPLSVKQRIKRLPDHMDNLYTRYLESLTQAQRQLVTLALKRIVWSPDEMNTLEIIEEFKLKYCRKFKREDDIDGASDSGDSSDGGEVGNNERCANGEGQTLSQNNPIERAMREPEIIYTMYHLESAGREFFKFSNGKLKIDVIHKSVRDWVENESRKATGQLQSSDKFSMTDLFQWGESGEFKIMVPKHFFEGRSSKDFQTEKDAHLDILIYIFEVLTNQKFQEDYMPKGLPEESSKTDHFDSTTSEPTDAPILGQGANEY